MASNDPRDDLAPFIDPEAGPGTYFETHARRAARQRLSTLLATGTRLSLLTGEAGAGKTRLLDRVVGELDPSVWTICTLDARDAMRSREVLGALLRVLGESDADIGVGVQLSRVGVRLATRPGGTVLVIDSAEKLHADVLGVLLALASRPASASCLVVVLCGRPLLLVRVQSVASTWESTSSVELVDVPPLDRAGVADYLHARVHGAGERGDSPFGEALIDWLARASRGYPGWVDTLAAHALHAGAEAARRARRRARRRRAAAWWLASGLAASAASMAVASAPSRDSAMDAVWRSVTPAIDVVATSRFHSSIIPIE